MFRLALALCLLGSSPVVAQTERPNIVFLLADDISQEDIGCYGHPSMKTPNMDRLASAGLRFDNAYLTISSCSPSRCSIITGRYPHNTGAPELHTQLPKDQITFPKLLKDSGYYTALSGKHHMGKAVNVGFDKVSSGKGPGKEEDWVALLRDRPKDRPFFFWFAATDAHRTWAINDDAPHYASEAMVVPPYLVDDKATRDDLTGYAHEVSRFDHFIGEVVKELEAQKILDSTMIVVAADNGRPFPRCKTRLYDSGIKTPFIVHYPDLVKPGVTSSLISSIDLSATLLELAKVDKHPRIQGVSFAPLLSDPNQKTRDVVFAEHNWHVYKNHERMVRFGNWIYVRNHYPNQQNLCVEAKLGGAGQSLWQAFEKGNLTEAQRNIFWNPCPQEELYNVDSDPHQITNLASDPKHQEALQQARTLLMQWTKQTGDSVPTNPTPDRDARPGQTAKKKRGHRHLEMPGDSNHAQNIEQSGPVRF